MKDSSIGHISHYYDKIGVAVLELTGSLKVGDSIKITKGDQEFTQTVNSMQVEHQPVKLAKKGDSVGLKVDQPVKPGAKVSLAG